MPKGSPELTNSRREEIINACESLYEDMNFKDITIKEIGNATSFTRTSIYNYFQTKEEIFLALLQREYTLWAADIDDIRNRNDALEPESLADALAHTLERRRQMLKMLSMNLYDVEEFCRLDTLVEFKKTHSKTLGSMRACLEKFFPKASEKEVDGFIYSFLAFVFGIYPYTMVTDKQAKAMELAGINYPRLSIYDISFPVILKLLPSK